jgi:hypothetical protein
MLTFSMPNTQEIEQLINFCKVMASSPFYQKLGPGGVMAIYLTAKERDLPFMACLNGGLHSVDGKITYSALMIDALIMKAGHKTKLLHLDEKSCTVRFTRGDRKNDPDYEPLEFTYTIDDARIAGYLTKNNWKNNPKPMLYSRCITGGGRIHMSEVFLGVLVQGELVGSNSDGDIMPQLPDHIATNLLPESNGSVKEIKHRPAVGFNEFLARHQMSYTEKEGPSLAMEYVEKVAALTRKSEVEIINSAMQNEDGFIRAFEKWAVDQGKSTAPERDIDTHGDESLQQQNSTASE